MANKVNTEAVLKNVVKALEGIGADAKWKCPWSRNLPYNASTGKVYRGINLFITAFSGFSSAGWLTFNQAKALGGFVRGGEKGTTICYWQILEKTEENDKGEDETKKIPLLKTYTIFNLTQIEGLNEAKLKTSGFLVSKVDDPTDAECIESALAFCNGVGAEIRHGGERAAYNYGADRIMLPNRDTFVNDSAYVSTFAHELGHWTGAKERLDRDLANSFGTEKYAKEELVAELTAAFVCGIFGIEGTLQHPEYIAHWLKACGSQPNLVMSAATQAQKAIDFLLEAASKNGVVVAEPTSDDSEEMVA